MLNNLPIFSVLFCINSFYVRQLVVLITSIQKNNPNKNFNFYIFHTDLSKHDEVFLKELENQKCKLIFKSWHGSPCNPSTLGWRQENSRLT